MNSSAAAALKFSEDRNGGRLSPPTPRASAAAIELDSTPCAIQSTLFLQEFEANQWTMDVHNIVDDYSYLLQQGEGGGEKEEESINITLTSVDLKIAFAVEKLLSLETLVMDTARRAADLDPLALTREEEDPPSDPAQAQALRMAFEFDVLRTIVDSEVGELQKLAASIRTDIQGVGVAEPEHDENRRMKLQAATEALDKMQDLIAAIRRESATFDKPIQQQQQPPSEDQASVLQMLQKSIASELDLDKELCVTRSVVEELKAKLYHAEQRSYLLEEAMEGIYQRMLSAENTSQVLLGTSKDLLAQLNTIRCNLLSTSPSVPREGLLLSSNKNDKIPNPSQLPEFSAVRDQIRKLEDWLRDSGLQPQWSEFITIQDTIDGLKLAISKAESRTQNAEARCTQLTQTNHQLCAELNSDRVGLLEKRLKESDTQLEHAKASVDAVVEQQSMLKSSMCDMEQTIEDLKEKFFKAETRAENAESKCKLLTDTNLELSEELSFLRGRVEGLENSLRQANQLKKSTEKDIGTKTKTITDLVAKLALERERLHLQIVTLTKKNKMLAQKCRENVNETTLLSKKSTAKEGELRTIDAKDEAAVHYSSTQRKLKVTPTVNALRDQEAELNPPMEDDSGAEITLETVRAIDPSQLNLKYISLAVLVFLAAALVYLLYKEGNL